jgi:hypothetical protein
VPGGAALDDVGVAEGPECGRTSRHSDDAPPGPVCGEGAGGPADAGAGAGAAADDAVKEGRRSAGEKTEGPGLLEPELGGGGAMIEPPGTAGAACLGPVPDVSSSAEESLLPDALNQLVVAAIADRTAWRPLSSTPLAADAWPSG